MAESAESLLSDMMGDEVNLVRQDSDQKHEDNPTPTIIPQGQQQFTSTQTTATTTPTPPPQRQSPHFQHSPFRFRPQPPSIPPPVREFRLQERRDDKSSLPDYCLKVDVPIVYLSNRSKWLDFLEGLHNCAVTWGLPDYATTVLYGGEAWEVMKASRIGPQLRYLFDRRMVESIDGKERDGAECSEEGSAYWTSQARGVVNCRVPSLST